MSKFIITIGRELGSGGRLIAQKLSQLMQLPVFDKELINIASEESGVCKEFFEKMDEKVGYSTFGGLFGLRNSLMDEVLSGNYLSNESLFKIQSDVIREIAEQRSVIFLGRCADYVLKDHPRILNIYISANQNDRITRVVEEQNIDEKKAQELIDKMDKKRKSYYNYFSNRIWGKANSYDLCINSSYLGIEETSNFIHQFAKKKFGLE